MYRIIVVDDEISTRNMIADYRCLYYTKYAAV